MLRGGARAGRRKLQSAGRAVATCQLSTRLSITANEGLHGWCYRERYRKPCRCQYAPVLLGVGCGALPVTGCNRHNLSAWNTACRPYHGICCHLESKSKRARRGRQRKHNGAHVS